MYKFKIPCSDCIALPMCFNKSAYQVAYCELLEPILHERCVKLSPYNSILYEGCVKPNPHNKIHNKLELRLTPLNATILLIRETTEFGSVHTVNPDRYIRLIYLLKGGETK